MTNAKKIYVVISYSESIPAKLINAYTKETYAHSSVSLDISLENIYSFGRKKPNNFLIAGFVTEKIGQGVYKKFKNTICKVIEVDVSEESYGKLKNEIEKFLLEKGKYHYSYIGLFSAMFNKRISRERHFYCTEFVRTVLERADIDLSKLPKVCHAKDFLDIPNSRVIYDGLLNNYCVK